MSFRSLLIVTLLALFAFVFGFLLHRSSIAFLPALLFAGFILFGAQQFLLKELIWFTWAEFRSLVRPLDFFFILLGLLGTLFVLPKMVASSMPLELVAFMAFTVFALIFLSSYWIFYEDR